MFDQPIKLRYTIMLLITIILTIIALSITVYNGLANEDRGIPQKCMSLDYYNNPDDPRYKVCDQFDIQFSFLPLIHNSPNQVISCIGYQLCEDN
jgi:hypothetical protein